MAAPAITTLGSAHISNPNPVTHPFQNLAQANSFYANFGAAKPNTTLIPYDATNRATWTLPEGLLGNNRFLGNTMRLVAMANNSAILKVFLPIVRAEGALTSSWSRWEFPTFIPDVVPERGVVRLVRANRISGGESMRRYGVGLFMEHGFMNTPQGIKHYMMSLKQVNQSISEGLQFQGLYAIATAEDWTKRFLKEHQSVNPFNGKKMMDVMKRELTLWAFLQQNRNAWVQLDAYITQANDLYNHGVQLTHYLTDARVSHFRKIIPQERSTFLIGGRKSPLTHDGVEARTVDEMGNIIHTTRAYLVDTDGPITPMQQETEIGEHFISRDLNSGSKYRGVTSRNRNIEFYNEDIDSMDVLTLPKMLANCNRFRPDGKLWGLDSPEAMRHDISNFTKEELDADFLHYLDSDGKRRLVTYFGNINQPHLKLNDYVDMAHTALNQLHEDTSRSYGDMMRIFAEGRRVIRQMADVRFNEEYNALWRALARKNASGGLELTGGRGLPDAMRATQWSSNAYGSLDLPVLGELSSVIEVDDEFQALLTATAQAQIAIARSIANPGSAVTIRSKLGTYAPNTVTVTTVADGKTQIYQNDAVAGYAKRFQLPPSHLTWGGLRTISSAYRSDLIVDMGFNLSAAKSVHEFVILASEVVEAMNNYFPESIFLSADYANSWTPSPTSQDTFFEALFMQGISTVPIFLHMPDTANGDVRQQTVNIRARNVNTEELAVIEDVFKSADAARTYLQESIIGVMHRSDANDRAEVIGSRFDAEDTADNVNLTFAATQLVGDGVRSATESNAFVTKRYDTAMNGKDVRAPEDVEADVGTPHYAYTTTYDRLVAWTMLARATGGVDKSDAALRSIVYGAAGTSMVLATLMLVAPGSSVEVTMENYKRVLDKISELTGVEGTTLNHVTSLNHVFSAPGALGRYASGILNFFRAYPDLIADGVNQVDVMRGLFEKIGSDAQNFDVTSLRTQEDTMDMGDVDDVHTNTKLAALQRLSGYINSHSDSFFRAPIVITSKALNGFADYAVTAMNGQLATDTSAPAMYGWPSSPKNSLTKIGVMELVNSISAGVQIIRKHAANAMAGVDTIGADITEDLDLHPIYLDNDRLVGRNLSHNSVLRKAFQMQMSNEFQDPDQSSELAQSSLARFVGGNRSRTLGAADISAAYGQSANGNPFFSELQRERVDRTEESEIRFEDAAADIMDRESSKRARHSSGKIRDALAYSRTTGTSVTEALFSGSSRGEHVQTSLESGTGGGDYGTGTVNAFLAKHMSRNFEVMYANIASNMKGLLRIAALAFLGTPVKRQAMDATITYNLMHPFNYVCARSHSGYSTITVTKMKPGIETGRTNLGQIKVEMGDDADTGVHHANITYYSNSEITAPKNIFNARNVLVVGYIGGLGGGFYDRNNYSPVNKNYGRDSDSFHIMAISRNEIPEANPISLTGHYDWVDNDIYKLHPQEFSSLTYTTAPFNNGWWGWSQQRFGVSLDYSMFNKYRTERSIPNCLTFASYAGYMDSDGTVKQFTSQTGHWQIQSVGAGMAQARIGLKPMDNSPIMSRIASMTQIPR